MPNFELICGDCITEIERLTESGRKFDAIFTDPPYCSGGTTVAEITCGRGIQKYVDKQKKMGSFSDNMSQHALEAFTRQWLVAARPLLNDIAYVFIFCDWRQIPIFSDALQSAGYVWRGLTVWDKTNSRPNQGQILQCAEFCVWGTVGKDKSDKWNNNCVIRKSAPPTSDRIHPTQKDPTVIAEWLKILPDNARAVLDPFNGSGSTGIAALSLGLDYVGIDLSPDFIEASRGRLTDSLKTYEYGFKDTLRKVEESLLF